MAIILPFKAVRPAAHYAHLVASRSVDGYSIQDLNEKLAGNPYTFLHVINPDFEQSTKTKPGSPERLIRTRNQYSNFKNEQILIKEKKLCYYVYKQTKLDRSYVGLIACCSVDDYFNGVIKVHEQTLTEREEKLMEYLDVCEFNAEPVLFSYKDNKIINAIIASVQKGVHTYDFMTTDKVRHSLWLIDDKIRVEKIKKEFEKCNAIYIADGHHRSASSALLASRRRAVSKKRKNTDSYNFYLGALFPESQLKIYDFNRIIKDLGNLSAADFLSAISESFNVKKHVSKIYRPKKKGEIAMYLDKYWYSLTCKKLAAKQLNPADELDASILTKTILSPILCIHDLKTDKRVGFVNGTKGMEELKKQVDIGKAAVAFALFPVTMNEIKLIADTHSIMPPKTTYVEPKLRSGLVIYEF